VKWKRRTIITEVTLFNNNNNISRWWRNNLVKTRQINNIKVDIGMFTFKLIIQCPFYTLNLTWRTAITKHREAPACQGLGCYGATRTIRRRTRVRGVRGAPLQGLAVDPARCNVPGRSRGHGRRTCQGPSKRACQA